MQPAASTSPRSLGRSSGLPSQLRLEAVARAQSLRGPDGSPLLAGVLGAAPRIRRYLGRSGAAAQAPWGTPSIPTSLGGDGERLPLRAGPGLTALGIPWRNS